jgi:hypothetical protein
MAIERRIRSAVSGVVRSIGDSIMTHYDTNVCSVGKGQALGRRFPGVPPRRCLCYIGGAM